MLAGAAVAAEKMNEYSVNLATNNTLGSYLVNQTGFTLYYFNNDALETAPVPALENAAKSGLRFMPKNLDASGFQHH